VKEMIDALLCSAITNSLGISKDKFKFVFYYKYKETLKSLVYIVCFGEGYFSKIEFLKKDLLYWSEFIGVDKNDN